jgi:biopolymer transport protein ExbD
MPRRKRRASKIESSINVTPMGDVSLSLLLGFLVITPIIIQTLSATLPQGGGVASGQVKQDPVVVLTAEGKILINAEEIAREDVPARLEELFPKESLAQRKVLFTGAPEVPYEDVIGLIDLLKANGVEAFGIR